MEREREQEIMRILTLIHFPNVHKSQGWAGAAAGVRNAVQLSVMGGRDPTMGSSLLPSRICIQQEAGGGGQRWVSKPAL